MIHFLNMNGGKYEKLISKPYDELLESEDTRSNSADSTLQFIPRDPTMFP